MDDVRRVIDFALTDNFWHKNILSPESLRRNFDQLTVAMLKLQPAQRKFAPMAEHKEE